MTNASRRRLDAAPWTGPVRRYDIIKEATIALLAVVIATVALAVLSSSPDEPPVTLQAWAKSQPVGFTDIALSELDGTSSSATYGPPYNHAKSTSVQSLGPVSLQKAFGVHFPIDAPESFVLQPLEALPPTPALSTALRRYGRASALQRARWEAAYTKELRGRALSSAGNTSSPNRALPYARLKYVLRKPSRAAGNTGSPFDGCCGLEQVASGVSHRDRSYDNAP